MDRLGKSTMQSYGSGVLHIIGVVEDRASHLIHTQLERFGEDDWTTILRLSVKPHCFVNGMNGIKILHPSFTKTLYHAQPMAAMRAIYRQQQTVKYDVFWDFGVFITELEKQRIDMNDELEVRYRLIVILRIVLIGRSVDIFSIMEKYETDRNNTQVRWIKIKRKGRSQYEWEMISPGARECMCPFKLWDQYLLLSKNHRTAVGEIRTQEVRPGKLPRSAPPIKQTWTTDGKLFVSSMWRSQMDPEEKKKDPETFKQIGFGPLALSTIRIASKKIMGRCNINTDDYGAASMRGALASWLMRMGMDPQIIMSRANWLKMSTFLKHYSRSFKTLDWTSIVLRDKEKLQDPANARIFEPSTEAYNMIANLNMNVAGPTRTKQVRMRSPEQEEHTASEDSTVEVVNTRGKSKNKEKGKTCNVLS